MWVDRMLVKRDIGASLSAHLKRLLGQSCQLPLVINHLSAV
jgi:hypothetical protein